jgi:cell division protein FtsB
MRIFKYLFALWTAVAVYTLLSFLGGPRGFSAYNYLLAEKEQQQANIEELWTINEELERVKNNLLYDHDTLLVHARQMGYGYEDEKFVRIVGLGNTKSDPVMTGKVYTAQNPDYISDKNIKIAALCVGLLVFSFLLMMEVIEKKVLS